MKTTLHRFLIAAAVIAAPYVSAAAGEERPLTKSQIERYIASYDALLNVLPKYWGDRRFTPHGIIMPHRGTIERAMVEMEAEGTLQDFHRLFTGQGFDGYDAWLYIAERVANAQFQIMATERGKPVEIMSPDRLKAVLAQRDKYSNPIPQMPEHKRQQQLRSLNQMLNQHESWEQGLRDMAVVRPFEEQLRKLVRSRKDAVRQAKRKNQ